MNNPAFKDTKAIDNVSGAVARIPGATEQRKSGKAQLEETYKEIATILKKIPGISPLMIKALIVSLDVLNAASTLVERLDKRFENAPTAFKGRESSRRPGSRPSSLTL